MVVNILHTNRLLSHNHKMFDHKSGQDMRIDHSVWLSLTNNDIPIQKKMMNNNICMRHIRVEELATSN